MVLWKLWSASSNFCCFIPVSLVALFSSDLFVKLYNFSFLATLSSLLKMKSTAEWRQRAKLFHPKFGAYQRPNSFFFFGVGLRYMYSKTSLLDHLIIFYSQKLPTVLNSYFHFLPTFSKLIGDRGDLENYKEGTFLPFKIKSLPTDGCQQLLASFCASPLISCHLIPLLGNMWF